MKFISIFLLAFHLVAFSPQITANEQKPKQMNHFADEALRLTQFGAYEHAKSILMQLGEKLSGESIKNDSYTMEELSIITETYEEAKAALTATSMSEQERIRKVTALRLVLDAHTSTHQPLWLSMRNEVFSSLDQLKQDRRTITSFIATYSVIQPSLRIDFPEEINISIESKLQFLSKSENKLDAKQYDKLILKLTGELEDVFNKATKSSSEPSVWWVIITTGSIILSTLTYVSIRKYQAEKKNQKKRKVNR